MKVIDLLNKIANGEEVPKEIKIKGWDYKFELNDDGYMEVNEDDSLTDYIYSNEEDLNREVEIIEEDKKIEKIDRELNCDDDTIGGLVASVNGTYKEIADKINEIIEVLNNEYNK